MQTSQNNSEKLISEILKEKYKFECQGKTPKVILLGMNEFYCLKEIWIEEVKNASYGILLGLMVFKVDTIGGFEVR